MITGDIKSQIDRIWDAFWSGGISNPLEVIEQITYLLFLRRLDDLQTLEENKAHRLEAADRARASSPRARTRRAGRTRTCAGRASRTSRRPRCTTVVGEHVFPFLRTLGGDGSTYAHHMKDARFTIPTPALLAKVVDLLDDVPMEDRDTKGDLYEYMLGKIATAGQNGQFRTPRHIIRLMVEMTAPTADGRHLRPGLRHRGLPGRGGRVPARAPSGDAARREAARALPPRHVPRLRLRQHHAAHRQHEHAAARRREPGHPLPRLAGAGPRRRGGEVHAGARQSAVRRLARLREHRQGPAADRQDEEDRAALPRAVPAAAQARRPRGGDRARRRAVRLEQGAQGRCAGCWSRTRSSTP